MAKLTKLILLLTCLSGNSLFCQAQQPTDPVLFAYGEAALFDGKYGKVRELQAALLPVLAKCRITNVNIATDGRFGANTAEAIRRVSACPALKAKLADGSAAFAGAVTVGIWRALLPRVPPPTIEQRAQTLVLTYEATDYDNLEWNFCQSRPRWSPDDPTKPCYTNDPRSYITWGPRGATAGHGREVQWILWRLEQRNPRLLPKAFGAEVATVRQLLALDDDSARRLLCTVFADTPRRTAWTAAFASLGREPLVRDLYDAHYLSQASDGAKMTRLYRLWEILGLQPTAVDYAFFLDRATHSSPPAAADGAVRIAAWLKANAAPVTSAQVRRAFAASFPTANQTQDRLGRDVAFFIDSFGTAGLSEAELAAWQKRGKVKASDVGLTDYVPAPALVKTVEANGPAFTATLNPAPICPPPVLLPQKPPR